MSGGKFNQGGHFPDRVGLPLTGGTLTGALVGTTASFSGKITSTAAGSAFEATAGAFESALATAFALYASNAAGGAKVGSNGFDVHTAGLCFIGKTTATGVQVGRTGQHNYLAAHNAAPTDGNILAGGIAFYLDESGHNLLVRVRYADGTTYKLATIALA